MFLKYLFVAVTFVQLHSGCCCCCWCCCCCCLEPRTDFVCAHQCAFSGMGSPKARSNSQENLEKELQRQKEEEEKEAQRQKKIKEEKKKARKAAELAAQEEKGTKEDEEEDDPFGMDSDEEEATAGDASPEPKEIANWGSTE